MSKTFFQVTIKRTNEDGEDFDTENDSALIEAVETAKAAMRNIGYKVSSMAVLSNCVELTVEELGE